MAAERYDAALLGTCCRQSLVVPVYSWQALVRLAAEQFGEEEAYAAIFTDILSGNVHVLSTPPPQVLWRMVRKFQLPVWNALHHALIGVVKVKAVCVATGYSWTCVRDVLKGERAYSDQDIPPATVELEGIRSAWWGERTPYLIDCLQSYVGNL